MSLDAVLLGFLDEPRSGYDLKKLVDRSADHYWSATLTQIYTTLKQLEARGQVVGADAPSTRGPKRRIYRRTPAGDHRLQDWLEAGPPDLPRQAAVAQLIQLHRLDGEGQARYLVRWRRSVEDRLALTRAAIARCGAPLALEPSALAEYLVLALIERRLTADLAWHDEATALLDVDGGGAKT